MSRGVAICSRVEDYEGDVTMALDRCCGGGSNSSEGTFDHNACPSNPLLGSESKMEYGSASASVCSYTTPQTGVTEYRNPYFNLRRQTGPLTEPQRSQLCSALEGAAPPAAGFASISFSNPDAAHIGPVVTQFSMSKGEKVRANYESEADRATCQNALRDRKQRVEEYMKLKTYEQMCDRYELEFARLQVGFCAGLKEQIATKRSEIQGLEVADKCSQFNNPDLRNLMHSLVEFTTSESKVLNAAGFSVCSTLPSIFYRRLVNPSGIVNLTGDCENAELVGPGGVANPKMNIHTAKMKSCPQTERFLTSLDIVFNSGLMDTVGKEGDPDRMEKDPSFNVLRACSNFLLDPSAMVQLNNLGRTNSPSSTFTPGIFATEFGAVKDGSFLRSTSASLQDRILKQDEFLENFTVANMDLGNTCRFVSENRETLCHLESTDVEPRPLPFFSNNPFLQLYSIRKQLGVVDDFQYDVVDLNPVGASPLADCVDVGSPLGVCG